MKAARALCALFVCVLAWSQGANSIRLRRVKEPREGAFTMLVPAGWIFEGGVLRLNPFTTNGVTNTVGAKFDFQVKKDAVGTVLIHWLPSMTYCDTRAHPDHGASFPPGSSYQGMRVVWLMDPLSFLERMVFPQQHPRARNMQILERKPAPELAHSWNQRVASMPPQFRMPYSGGVLYVTYDEDGVKYKERLMAVIEGPARMSVGMWSNKDTMLARAPAPEFERQVPVFALMQDSITSNLQWAVGEQRGSAQRARLARENQQYIQKVASEIVEHRRQMNAEIRHSMWLNMTNQEDYVNPHTGQVEQGSNQWKHRWIAGNGDAVYTDDPNYDPNWDKSLKQSDFKRTPVRER